MSLVDKLVGNATAADKKEVEALVAPILIPGETMSHAYHVGTRDKLIFTTLRLVFIDKKGMSGKKVTTSSFPWKSLNSWNTTTAGYLDTNGELAISVRGESFPMAFSFGNTVDIQSVAKIVSRYVLT